MSRKQLQSHLEFVNNLVAHLPPQGFDSQWTASDQVRHDPDS